MSHVFAALVGNGLSVPYAPALSVPALTAELIVELEKLGGTDAGDALAALASHIRGSNAVSAKENFEHLLGPVEATGAAIEQLRRIAALTGNASSVQGASDVLTDFSRAVHRLGIATVLGHVAARSEARKSDERFVTTIRSWVDAFRSLPSDEPRVVGSLNYDGLIHAAALDLDVRLADMSTGYERKRKEHRVVCDGAALVGHMLRTHDNLPATTLQVLNLHGSLGWLRAPDGSAWKFELSDLRMQEYWSAFATGNTTWTPTLILTDRKSVAVAESPFSLAYDIFRARLTRADRWTIVGYGFDDEPVNNVLRTAANLKDADSKKEIRILVIDYEKDPAQLKRRVASTIGLPADQIQVDTAGIPDATGGAPWRKWAG